MSFIENGILPRLPAGNAPRGAAIALLQVQQVLFQGAEAHTGVVAGPHAPEERHRFCGALGD